MAGAVLPKLTVPSNLTLWQKLISYLDHNRISYWCLPRIGVRLIEHLVRFDCPQLQEFERVRGRRDQ